MLLTEIVPHSTETVESSSDDARAWLARRYEITDASFVRLNMIASLTGAAAGADGTSETLSSRVDRMVLGVIRRSADVVVVGARTVRAEGYVLPRTARLAIVTATGDLAGHRLDLDANAGAGRVLLLCPAGTAGEVRRRSDAGALTVVEVAERGGRMHPEDMIRALRERDLRRVVCEGGSSLASQFAAADVIDEYCITTAPTLEPAEHPFIDVDPLSRPDTYVAGMIVDAAGFSYLRLLRRRPA